MDALRPPPGRCLGTTIGPALLMSPATSLFTSEYHLNEGVSMPTHNCSHGRRASMWEGEPTTWPINGRISTPNTRPVRSKLTS